MALNETLFLDISFLEILDAFYYVIERVMDCE